jgi:hypothetical protein
MGTRRLDLGVGLLTFFYGIWLIFLGFLRWNLGPDGRVSGAGTCVCFLAAGVGFGIIRNRDRD